MQKPITWTATVVKKMKIKHEEFNPEWATEFSEIHKGLSQCLQSLDPKIEHIGSTSILGLTAKPIIDVLVGVQNTEQLDKVILPLISEDYIYYEKYNSVMPYRRFFVKLKPTSERIAMPNIFYEKDEIPNELNDFKLAHIHVLEYNSYQWKRHIAFKEFLKEFKIVRQEYQNLKLKLGKIEWNDSDEYNSAKNEFIKITETKAIEWYEK